MALMISLFVAEGYLRIFHPQITTKDLHFFNFSFNCFTAGDSYYLALKKNSSCLLQSMTQQFPDLVFATNDQGLRNRAISIPKPAGTIRILVLGDSMVFGWGVYDDLTFVHKTETALRAQFPTKSIEIINAGIPATGVGNSYLFVKHWIDVISPDIIISELYPYTDVATDSRESIWTKIDADGLPLEIKTSNITADEYGMLTPKILPSPYNISFFRSSHLFLALYQLLVPSVRSPVTLPIGKVLLAVCLYKPERKECAEVLNAKEKVKQLITAMDTIAKERGIRFYALYIPAEFSVSNHITHGKYGGLESIVLPWEKDKIYNDFLEYFQNSGISLIDLKPLFLSHTSEQLFFALDDHWNPAGHALVAQTVTEILKKDIEKY